MFSNIMIHQDDETVKDDMYCDWINNSPPKVSISLSVKPVNMLPYMAKWILHM